MNWVELPNRLIVVDGEIIMADGSNLNEYLSAWQKKNKIENATPVVIHTRESAHITIANETFALAG
jgi:hypothetical protein